MADPVGPETEAAVLADYESSGSIRAAAAAGGTTFNTAKRVLAKAGKLPAEPPGEIRTAGTDSEQVVEFSSDKEIRTLDDAVAHAKVDLSVWRVRRWECGGWTTSMKLADYDPKGKKLKEAPVKKQNWRVRLWLERVLPRSLHDALAGVVESLKGCKAPAPPPARHHAANAVKGVPHLCVVDLVDLHFGKLAWAPETGQNYDLRIAEETYRDAVSEILARVDGFNIAEFLVPLGSDFLHVDGLGGMTTNGTPQDVDGRIAKILKTAYLATVWAVGEMHRRGRVVVRWIPGNHDRLTSYMLAMTIGARFHDTIGVQVDTSETARKYHRWEKTLIGLTHGNEEKHASLPLLMATEAKRDWYETECHEWHVGHLHKAKRQDFLPLDTHGGVKVRTLLSLSATDAWHYRKGYVGNQRAAEAYLYDPDGWVGSFCANVKGAA